MSDQLKIVVELHFYKVRRRKENTIIHCLRYTLLYMVVFLSFPLNGQSSTDYDTIKIKEVFISINKPISEQSGFKKIIIDSAVMINYNNKNLADILSENTNIFIKSYGMGGTATPAFRGTGASHTLIDWNGININSPMLGQSDLSLIPIGFIDDIQIYFGAASMSLNNGGIGGTINLETRPVWNKETLISLSSGIGSFGRYSGFIKVKAGNYKIQTVTKGFYQYADNNFRYLNNEIAMEPVWQTRTNNQVRQKGLSQELYFRRGKNITSARLWYQSADRNLPASMVTSNSGERQFDESLRTMLNYNAFLWKSNLSFTGAWMLNRLDYFNALASIDSRNLSESLTLKAGFENPIGEFSKLKIVLEELSINIKTNNYEQKITRSTTTLTALLVREKERFATTLLVREILDRQSFLIPDFSAGIQFRLIDEKEYIIKANFSRNSKIPTMNDMYWVPGGNPDLKNEYSLSSEISYEMKQRISKSLNLKYDLSVFRYSIKDMILWHPGEFSYWTADNIRNARSSGVESSVTLDFVQNRFNLKLIAGYSFTRSIGGGSKIENDVSAGKQLMYIPENQLNASLRGSCKNFYSSWTTNFISKRYITVDNTKYLPAYLINSIITGIKFHLKSSSIDLNFNLDNIFNVKYQSIAYYPLPGRSYNIKVLVQFVK